MNQAKAGAMNDSAAVGQLAQLFCQEMQALGGEAHIAENADQAAQIIHTYLTKWQIDTVAVSGEVFGMFPTVTQMLSTNGIAMPRWADEIKAPRDMESVAAGLVAPDWAIAATGTLALVAAPQNGRSLSLLPPVLFALTPASRLVAQRSEVFAGMRSGAGQSGEHVAAGLPSALAFITGPSRTADIESDLSIGVHGPGRVVAVVVMSS